MSQFVVLYIHTTTNTTNKTFFIFPPFLDKKGKQKRRLYKSVFFVLCFTFLFINYNSIYRIRAEQNCLLPRLDSYINGYLADQYYNMSF